MWRNIMDDYRLYCLNDLFEIKWILYGLSRMLQFSQFVWTLRDGMRGLSQISPYGRNR